MTPANESPELLKIGEIAAEFQVHPETVRNWIKNGELPATRMGRAWRVRREDLDAMVARQQGETMTLGLHRDIWNPQTLGSPFRRRGKPARARSVWDGTPGAVVPVKRS